MTNKQVVILLVVLFVAILAILIWQLGPRVAVDVEPASNATPTSVGTANG